MSFAHCHPNFVALVDVVPMSIVDGIRATLRRVEVSPTTLVFPDERDFYTLKEYIPAAEIAARAKLGDNLVRWIEVVLVEMLDELRPPPRPKFRIRTRRVA